MRVVQAQRGAALGDAHVARAQLGVEGQRRRVALQHVPVHAVHALLHAQLPPTTTQHINALSRQLYLNATSGSRLPPGDGPLGDGVADEQLFT